MDFKMVISEQCTTPLTSSALIWVFPLHGVMIGDCRETPTKTSSLVLVKIR